MVEIGRRRRSQPAPPHIVFGSLTDWRSSQVRPWLVLLDDERDPRVLEALRPTRVVWSSLWPGRPGLTVRFDLAANGRGTWLTWTLLSPVDLDDASAVGHLRKRLNVLISESLLGSYGQ